jgi:hypothetical protein
LNILILGPPGSIDSATWALLLRAILKKAIRSPDLAQKIGSNLPKATFWIVGRRNMYKMPGSESSGQAPFKGRRVEAD